jgi:hypothetical protein
MHRVALQRRPVDRDRLLEGARPLVEPDWLGFHSSDCELSRKSSKSGNVCDFG